MTNSSLLSRIDQRFWAALALISWGGALIFFELLRFAPYGIDEGATRALLLNWSVADQVVNPIFIYGMPDFRALLFIPLGIYWPGSVIAAKMFTVLITFAAIWLLFNWSKRTQSDEAALIASGLALVAPATLLQVDAIGLGPYLLLLFAGGQWLHEKYRAQERELTGWYFTQLLLVATAVTMHPAGLAYPAVLAWTWSRETTTKSRRIKVFAGIGITVAVILVMRAGLVALPWFTDPLASLGTALFGLDPLDLTPRGWIAGAAPFVVLGTILYFDRRFLASDFLGLMLTVATLFGLFAADAAWALVATTLMLYRGTAVLIAANNALHAQSFFGQRGIVLVVLFVLATVFMQIDKAHARNNALGLMTAEDELIHTLATQTDVADEKLRVASQWPGRTMFALKRAVLPLPPAQESDEKFAQQIKGLTHIMFAHNDPRNAGLARNIAALGGGAETLALQGGGVIVKLRTAKDTPAPEEPKTAN